MRAQIISIGNELLMGDTVNSNAAWIGQQLTDAGIEVSQIHTIADDPGDIKQMLKEALPESELVITTGGLGPTHDDITKQAVTELFDCKLVVDEKIVSFIKKTFKKRNIPFSESNYHQAEVPDCCEIMFNEQGTAPGLWFDRGEAALGVLPGVPYEMKHLVRDKLLPKLRSEMKIEPQLRKSFYLTTAGIGESTLSDEVIGDITSFLDDRISLAYLPNPWGTRIRISAKGTSQEEVNQKIEPLVSFIKKRAQDHIIGEGKDQTLANAIGAILIEHQQSLAVAESCTGGYLGNAITNIPGCSRYFKGGMIAYADEVKINQLGVNKDLIEEEGAVSKEVALQMAQGTAQRCGASIGVSTTGIAGPSGGTEQKPVGTVWIGFWSSRQHFALHTELSNKRLINKQRASAVALDTIRRLMQNISAMPYGFQKQEA